MPKSIGNVSDLAVFGAAPLFEDPLHVGRPNPVDRERLLARIDRILDSRRFTNNGPMVQELESRLADYLGVRHCVAVSNGTLGLEVAIRALDLRGEVIIPSFTFVATAHALQWQQITPVFADVDLVTCTLAPESVERMITPRTTGIIGVHVFGRACAVTELQSLANRHRLKLLFDAAHAVGCSHEGKMIGNFGECEVLSFHATKFFSTFEGGAIVTNSDVLAHKLRLMRNFGFRGVDDVVSVGTNAKMPEICAAMGLTTLETIDEVISLNKINYHRYAACIADVPGLRLITNATGERTNYQYVVVEVGDGFGLDRDCLADILRPENILARRYFHPGCHSMEPYRSLFPDAGSMLPNTNELSKRVVCLPTGPSVGAADIDAIGELLRFLASHAGEIRARRPKASNAARSLAAR